MNTHPNVLTLWVSQRATTWRAQAAMYAGDGNEMSAKILERCAVEMECDNAAAASSLVSLTDASRLTGYSADHLGLLIRQSKLVNYGTKYRPKVQRGALPSKPALLRPRPLPILRGRSDRVPRKP